MVGPVRRIGLYCFLVLVAIARIYVLIIRVHSQLECRLRLCSCAILLKDEIYIINNDIPMVEVT